MRRIPNSRRRAKRLDELRLNDSYGKKVLSTHALKLIPVIEEEAHRFGCNAVVVGKTVVHMLAAGYASIEVELDEFVKAGGSAKCLTPRLDGEEAASWEGKQPWRAGSVSDGSSDALISQNILMDTVCSIWDLSHSRSY